MTTDAPMPTAAVVLEHSATTRARILEAIYRGPYEALLTAAESMRAEDGEAKWADALEAYAHGLDQQAARHLRARLEVAERPTQASEPAKAEGASEP